MEWISIAVATDVIAVSDSLGRELVERRLVDPTKAWIIGEGSSNGVDSPRIRRRIENVDPNSLKGTLGIPSEAFVVGYIGRITRDKGVDTLLDAYRAIDSPGVHLLMIGDVEDTSLALEAAALGNRVHMVDWTDDVWGLLPAIDVLALPSQREGFPTVVLEAAAAGIPAITTRVTGAVDSVIDGETGILIQVGNRHELEAAMRFYLENPRERLRMGTAAEARARRDFQQGFVWEGISSIIAGSGGKFDFAEKFSDRLPMATNSSKRA